MALRSRPANSSQRERMRSCLFSVCETARDLTPIYLCDKPRIAGAKYKEQVCLLYDGRTTCGHDEIFPERFNT